MRVFLTGGTGFIGLALTSRLLAEGIEVVSTAHSAPPEWSRPALGDGVRFERVDVRDKAALTAALRAARPDILIHGAALTPDEERERAGGTAAIFEVNVAGTANAIEAAAEAGVGRVMAFSSGAAYGRTIDETPVLDEAATECRPEGLYAISKYAAERVALRLGGLHGISVVTPRLSAAWGPWEYRTSERQTLSPAYQIIAAAARGETPVVPAGAVLPLIFSEDAARVLVRLALTPAAEGVFNVGSDRMVDLGALARDALDAAAAHGTVPRGVEQPIRIFIAGRPPMSLARIEGAVGTLAPTDVTVAMRRTFDWRASLPGPGPF